MIVSIVRYLFCCGAAGMNFFVLPQPRGSRVGRRLHSAQIHTYMQHRAYPYTLHSIIGSYATEDLTSEVRRSSSCSKYVVKRVQINTAAYFYNIMYDTIHCCVYTDTHDIPRIVRTVSGSGKDQTRNLRGARVRVQPLPLI